MPQLAKTEGRSFRGTGDRAYRTEAWDFFVAGGSAFSNLDYSYSVKHPDGTAKVTTSPGGGGPELRRQLAILKAFLDGFDLVKMRPEGAALRGQADSERGYAVAAGAVEPDVTSIAAPVYGPDGGIVAALSVLAPSYRASARRIEACGRAVARHAAELSRELGHLEAAAA